MPIDTVTIQPPGSDGAFSDTAIGAIVWPKALGRPDKARLAEGFSILMYGTDVFGTGQGGLEHEIGFVLEPRVEEGNGGPDHWRVEFFQDNLKSVEGITSMAMGPIDAARKAQIERQATYRVTIDLRPGVAWSASRPVRIRPHERTFVKHDGTVDLPAFEITAA
jgi:hypothetical protein